MSKIWLNIFLLIFCFPLQALSQDCDCINCPSNIVDADTTEIIFRVNNIDNNDLSSIDQGVCEVFLKFNHAYIGDVTMDLVSPAGQTVSLIGPYGSSSPTFLASFNLTFLPCIETVMPDPGNPSNWNNSAVNGLGNYAGSYYPYQGCLENFNTGTVAGDWKLIIIDHQTFDSGNFKDIFITFCDPTGIDCCKADAGSLPSDEVYCLGDPNLLLDIQPTYINSAPPSSAFGYQYIITENDFIIGLEEEADLSTYPVGTYGICGISYALADVPFLPVPNGTININTIITLLNGSDPPLCADITDICMEVQIIDPPMEQFDSEYLCQGDTLYFGSNTIVEAGLYKDTLIGFASCDSIVNLDVIMKDTFEVYQLDFSCDPNLVGIDTVFLSSVFGCDSTLITETVFQTSDTTYVDPFTCDENLASTSDTTSYTTTNCDSVVITTFQYLPPDTSNVIDYTCLSSLSGTMDTVSFPTANCDSIVITSYELIESDTTYVTEETCDETMYAVSDTMSFETLACDSIVILTYELLALDTTFVEWPTCDPSLAFQIDSMVFGTLSCDSLVITSYLYQEADTTYQQDYTCLANAVGIDTTFFTNEANCDSLIITTISFSENDTTYIPQETCDPDLVGETVEVYPTEFCDSIVIITITELPKDTIRLTDSVCVLPTAMVDTSFFINQYNCDSLVVTSFVLIQSDTSYATESTCDLELVGIDTMYLLNQNNCDSLIITTFTLSENDTTEVEAYSCLEEELGSITEIFETEFCDSVVITTTYLLEGDTSYQSEFTCDENNLEPDTLFFQNQNLCDSLIITTYTLSENDTTEVEAYSCLEEELGESIEIFERAFCDSIVITTTYLQEADTSYQFDFSCDENNLDPDTLFLQNQNLCDSLVITNYELLKRDTSYSEAYTCLESEVGILEETFPTTECDSVHITTIFLIDIDTTYSEEGTCNPQEVGHDTTYWTNQFSCDSIHITNYVLTLSDTTWLEESYTCLLNEVGSDTTVYENDNCDSIVISTILFSALDSTFLSIPVCEGDPLDSQFESFLSSQGCDSIVVSTFYPLAIDTSFQTLYTQVASEAGMDTLVLESSFGCDSIVINTILFQENSPDTISTVQVTCDISQVEPDTIFVSAVLVEIINYLYGGSSSTLVEGFVCDLAEAGLDTTVYQNQFGCDSLFITNNIYEGPIQTNLINNTCLEEEVGIDTTFLLNAFGCDSLLIVDNQLVDSEYAFYTVYVCGLQEMYLDTVMLNAVPCPLFEVTTYLPGDSETSHVEDLTCAAEDYEETITLENVYGCDSTIIISFTSVLPETTFIEVGTCQIEEVGMFSEIFTSQYNCDSLVLTNVFYQEIDTIQIDIQTCKQEEVYSDSLLISSGDCDQLEITNYYFEALPATQIDSITCIEEDAGIFSSVFLSEEGCDSTVILNLEWEALMDTIYFEQTVCNIALSGMDTLMTNNLECPTIEITDYIFEAINDTSYQELASCDQDLIGTFSIDNFLSMDGCDSIVYTTFVEGEGDIDYEVNTTPVSCFGSSDGSVSLNIISDGIMISWSDGFIEEERTELPAGDYYITLSNGACDILEKVTVESPSRIITSVQPNIVMCNNEGVSLFATATGGLAPYEYNWSNGQAGDYIEQLPDGSYFVTVSDARACTAMHQATVFNVPALEINLDVQHLTCFASDDGRIKSTVISGTLPLSFEWNTKDNTQNLERLDPGFYNLTVVDDNDCRFEAEVEVLEPEEIAVEFFEEQGNLSVQVEGGVPDYSYLWSTGESTSSISNLEVGRVYYLSVTDASGCEVVEEYLMTNSSGVLAATSLLPVYPNPSKGVFYFDKFISIDKIQELLVFNNLGQKQAYELNSAGQYLDISKASPGTYFLYLNMGGQHFWQKLVLL